MAGRSRSRASSRARTWRGTTTRTRQSRTSRRFPARAGKTSRGPRLGHAVLPTCCGSCPTSPSPPRSTRPNATRGQRKPSRRLAAGNPGYRPSSTERRVHFYERDGAARIVNRRFKWKLGTLHSIQELRLQRFIVHICTADRGQLAIGRILFRDRITRQRGSCFGRTGDRCVRRLGIDAFVVMRWCSPGIVHEGSRAMPRDLAFRSPNEPVDDAHNLPKAWLPTPPLLEKTSTRSSRVPASRGLLANVTSSGTSASSRCSSSGPHALDR